MPSRSTASDETDALFKLPLGEFTAARNALASKLKKAGRADEAEQVKALVKPSISAWTVNQLYWQHRKPFEHLIAVGERFRKAQAAQLTGKSADVRGPLEERREALSALSRLAADMLKEGGHSATPEMMRRVTTTLEALSTYGNVDGAPRAGRLVDDVDPPGFESLAALVPRIADGSHDAHAPTRVLPFRQEEKRRAPKRAGAKASEEEQAAERKARLAAAQAAVRDAEQALRTTRRAAEQAEAALKKAAARAKDAEAERTAAEQRLEKATADFNEAKQQARRVAADAEQAAQDVEDAERALARAREQIDAIKAESAKDQ